MDKTFNAANGLQVRRAENGGVEIGKPGYLDYTGPAATFALEEFLQAEHDEKLGRWRSDADPHLVVYPPEDGYLLILDESDGEHGTVSVAWARGAVAEGARPDDAMDRAAYDYCTIHPERKPWQVAKVGEVWVLSTADGETAAYSVMSVREAGTVFESDEGRYQLTDPDIEGARRIWPEDAS